jgi:hypothetical protein
MRVTKVATTESCAVCERTLLMGERAVSFAPTEGAELVDVCPLCQELAVEAGWIKEGRADDADARERAPPPAEAQPRRVPRPVTRLRRRRAGSARADLAQALRR